MFQDHDYTYTKFSNISGPKQTPLSFFFLSLCKMKESSHRPPSEFTTYAKILWKTQGTIDNIYTRWEYCGINISCS